MITRKEQKLLQTQVDLVVKRVDMFMDQLEKARSEFVWRMSTIREQLVKAQYRFAGEVPVTAPEKPSREEFTEEERRKIVEMCRIKQAFLRKGGHKSHADAMRALTNRLVRMGYSIPQGLAEKVDRVGEAGIKKLLAEEEARLASDFRLEPSSPVKPKRKYVKRDMTYWDRLSRR